MHVVLNGSGCEGRLTRCEDGRSSLCYLAACSAQTPLQQCNGFCEGPCPHGQIVLPLVEDGGVIFFHLPGDHLIWEMPLEPDAVHQKDQLPYEPFPQLSTHTKATTTEHFYPSILESIEIVPVVVRC